MKNSFVLYTEYKDQFDLLSPEDAGILIKAIFAYASTGEVPELTGMPKMAFSFIKNQLDRDSEKYEKTVERRKEAGKKGGRPKANDDEEKANASFDVEEKANGFSEKQTKAKKPDNDNEDVNVNDNDNVNEDVDDNVDVDVDDNNMDVVKSKDYISCQLIVDMYNDTCVSFPRCTKISDAREKAIKARLKKYTVDDFRTVFELCEQSDFLKGSNNKNWSATFDWIIKDSNMAKILDGNYSRQRGQPKESGNPFMDLYNEMVEEEKNGFEGDYGGFGGY